MNGEDLSYCNELARVTQTTLPDGCAARSVYDGRAREAIDQQGHKRRYEADWAGRTVSVREYSGSGTGPDPYAEYACTSYGYDLADRLVSVTDALSHRTSISYDALGRKTAMADPDMGAWCYEYDAAGNLTAQADACGTRTENDYDKLNRITRTWHRASWAQEASTPPAR